MATTGALADFTKLPPQQKVMLFVVIGLVFGALYFQFVYKPLNQNLSDAQADHDQKVALNKKLADDIPKYEDLKTKASELTRRINANSKALPTETELPAFFETINHKLLDSGVEYVKSTRLPEVSIEGFVKVPIEMEVSGTFLQIKRFFASLAQRDLGQARDDPAEAAEDRDRIISIENLALTQPTVRNGVVTLNAKFIAATFRLDDSAGAGSGAAPKPGAGSAAKPAGAPTGAPLPPPATAPLPPASTPAAAKAQANAAVQAGDARDRNAAGVNEAKTPAAGSGSGTDRLKGGM